MLKSDLHTHTVASGHAMNTITEMAASAKEKGVELLGISDHGPAMEGAQNKNYFSAGARLPKEICGVRVLFGIEANILDTSGDLDLFPEKLERLDFVIAGLHGEVGYEDAGREENSNAIINAIKNPLVHIISHPYSCNFGFDVDIEKIAKAACEYDKLLEVNASYFYARNKDAPKSLDRIRRMVAILKENKKQIIINSDAHNLFDIARDAEVREKFDYLGLNEGDIINNDIPALKKYLKID